MRQIITIFLLTFLSVNASSQNNRYVNDNSTSGDLFTSAVGSNANPGSSSAPFASLQYAVTQSVAGDIIYVDAGSYAEQVIIDKGITIIGAGQNLTSFTSPASGLVPAPGPFTEIGLFETTQGIGDVNISDLTINSNSTSQNIIIQSGGSVKHCRLLDGIQGVFFRVESNAKSALIEGNTIQPNGIAINCQGAGLSATIRNNSIAKPTGFFSGIFAGLDFGPLPQLTIQNNIINNYFGDGIVAASFNGTYTSNSITGTGTFAINRSNNDGNTPIVTCNWFGTADAVAVAARISGTTIYSPFLTNGTDNSTLPGFQTTATCGNGNRYYVNDNSLNGDVFTTAVGNDANAGTASAPFATIQYAAGIAAANDIIYVDAGTYAEQVTLTKALSIQGAGELLTAVVMPATTAPPPGNFTEPGLIQTAQNIVGDVNIKDISVTGNLAAGVTPIILQTGGSLRNCKLQGGNQGLFVRVDATINPGSKSFQAEGNTIEAEYIAINLAGVALNARLSNNTIAAFNSGFSSGVFAGQDFGSLVNLTATNNLFSSYSTSGIQINAAGSNVTQNAFIGAGSTAINRTGGGNITANCNWYGTPSASSVVPKITPGVNYFPWYTDGTDMSAAAGFQHRNEPCGPSTNVFYVNDNNTTGDLFTTTVGDDLNQGTSPTSPLATINAAITQALPGATIYVDAGTYSAPNFTISKSVQIIGTNYNASPNSTLDPLLLSSGRQAESIISNSNLQIGADGIGFTGLTFNSGNANTIVLNNTTTAFGNISFTRNRLRASSIFAQLFFAGIGSTTMDPSSIANWGINIQENRFEKEDASFGNIISVSRFGNVTINNNSFVVTGSTPRTQTSINVGSAGVVTYLFIGRNNFDKVSSAVIGNRLGVVYVVDNKFINSNTAFNANNLLTQSSDVYFQRNTLDGNGGALPLVQYIRQRGEAAGSSSSFVAEENISYGNAIAGTSSQWIGFNFIFSNTVLNPTLIFSKNKLTYGGDFSSIQGQNIRPLAIGGNVKMATIDKNEISLNGTNLQPSDPLVSLPVCPAITLYTERIPTAFLQPGNLINIQNNKIFGFRQSFVVYDPATTIDAYTGFGNLPASVTVNVNNNSFTGDSISINNGTSSNRVLANCNWYGSAAAQNVLQKLSTQSVLFTPWLTNGTDNSQDAGFQPVENACDGNLTVITLDGSSNVTCNGASNGSINVTATASKLPLTYSWTKEGDADFVSNVEDPTDLAPGLYHLSIVDGNGSTLYLTSSQSVNPAAIDVTITEPPVLTASADGTHVTCFSGNNGTANVTASGGTAPYTYLWSNGSTTEAVSDLTAGTYSVTVTDANGCTASPSYQVTEPTVITVSASVINNTCFNGTAGSITASASGGTGAISYSLNDINYQTENLFTGLAAGNFTLFAKDANGCVVSIPAVIAQPTAVVITIGNVTSTCSGTSNGAIRVTATGGTGTLTYAWTGPNGYSKASRNINNLAPGTYTLTVTDGNGCSATQQISVQELPAINVSAAVTNVVCSNTLTGAVNLTIAGSSGQPTYSWTGPNGFKASTEDISGLRSGNYSVAVTDPSGCSFSSSYSVQPATAIAINLTKNDITNCGGVGSISLSVTGGSAPYQYQLNNNAVQSGASFSNLTAGSYSAKVTDSKGCSRTVAVTINDTGADPFETNNRQNTASSISLNQNIIARIAPTNADVDWYKFTTPAGTRSYTISLTHPSVVYTFNLYDSRGRIVAASASTATSKTYASLTGNTLYSIQVSGSTASFVCYNMTLTSPQLPLSTFKSSYQSDKVVKVDQLKTLAYPNPHQGSFAIKIESSKDGIALIDVWNTSGQLVAQKTQVVSRGATHTVKFSNMSQGMLLYRVRVGDESSDGKVIGQR